MKRVTFTDQNGRQISLLFRLVDGVWTCQMGDEVMSDLSSFVVFDTVTVTEE